MPGFAGTMRTSANLWMADGGVPPWVNREDAPQIFATAHVDQCHGSLSVPWKLLEQHGEAGGSCLLGQPLHEEDLVGGARWRCRLRGGPRHAHARRWPRLASGGPARGCGVWVAGVGGGSCHAAVAACPIVPARHDRGAAPLSSAIFFARSRLFLGTNVPAQVRRVHR